MEYQIGDGELGLDVILANGNYLARVRSGSPGEEAYFLDGKLTRPDFDGDAINKLAKHCVAKGLIERRPVRGRWRRVTDHDEGYDALWEEVEKTKLHRTDGNYFDLGAAIDVLSRFDNEEDRTRFRLSSTESGLCLAVLDFLDMDLKGKTRGPFGKNGEEFGVYDESGDDIPPRPSLLQPFVVRCGMLAMDGVIPPSDAFHLGRVAEYLARVERGYGALQRNPIYRPKQ